MAWLTDLIQLFKDMKNCITSSPILARFCPKKTVFLKTDWIVEGMAWILIQRDDEKEYKKSAKKIVAIVECNFDLEKTEEDYS